MSGIPFSAYPHRVSSTYTCSVKMRYRGRAIRTTGRRERTLVSLLAQFARKGNPNTPLSSWRTHRTEYVAVSGRPSSRRLWY